MKKVLLILVKILTIFVSAFWIFLTGEYIAPTEGIRVYDTDYIEKYESTLNAMFDSTWTLKLTGEKYEEHKPVCEHVDTRPQQFLEWTIEYHDGNGELRTFTFDNRRSLSSQIETYITHYIADYYKENFYDACIKDVSLAPSSCVFGFFVDNFTYSSYDEVKEMEKKTDNYLKNLDTSEGTICLSKLTPANVFEMCPIYLSIRVSFSNHPSDKQAFEETVMRQIEDMIEEMNRFTNNHLTASVAMGYYEIINLEVGNRECNWTYVQGKQIFNAAGLYFERYVFDGYKGMFW